MAKTRKPIDKDTLHKRTIYSTKEAAAFVGLSKSTFLHHIYGQGRIKPLQINPRLLVFSRAQLDDYVANGRRTDLVFDGRFYTFTDAAARLGIDLKEMREFVERHVVCPVDGVRIGGQFIYSEQELVRVIAMGKWVDLAIYADDKEKINEPKAKP